MIYFKHQMENSNKNRIFKKQNLNSAKSMKYMKKLLIIPLLIFIVGVAQAQLIDQDSKSRNQVIPMDLIVQGSECVGVDCPNSPSFGFNTIELRENNLRIRFFDTSNSASFPSNDWIIEINESSNGGENHFAIVDESGSRTPFKIVAGAPTNSLMVNSSGNIGIGTGSPVVEVHIKDGDTPTLRLEQDGSSGFTAQTWDLAGNEANFFVRDVTNGSKLPFRIKPNAPDASIYLDADGDVGMGAGTSPSNDLHLRRSDADETEMTIENTNGTTQSVGIRFINPIQTWNNQLRNNGNFRIRNVTGAADALEINSTTNDITTAGDITANGVMLTSDLRLKSNVQPFKEGLSIITQLNPISYTFNGKAGISSKRIHYSIGAQELQEVAPYLVHEWTYEKENENGKVESSENYLKIDMAAIPWVLVNAIKEQQDKIEKLEEKVSELELLNEELNLLKDKISEIEKALTIDNNDVLLKGGASLGQNYPNPFNQETVIEYFVPEFQNSAEIQFYDTSGKVIKIVNIAEGKGKISVRSNELPNGNYMYSLVLDGTVKETKRMIHSH